MLWNEKDMIFNDASPFTSYETVSYLLSLLEAHFQVLQKGSVHPAPPTYRDLG